MTVLSVRALKEGSLYRAVWIFMRVSEVRVARNAVSSAIWLFADTLALPLSDEDLSDESVETGVLAKTSNPFPK